MTHNLKDLQSVFNIYVLVGYFTDITLIIKNTARKEKNRRNFKLREIFFCHQCVQTRHFFGGLPVTRVTGKGFGRVQNFLP